MDLFYVLLLLLVSTRLLGELAMRMRQPALVGELLAGIVLGILAQRFSTPLSPLAALPDNEVFSAITDLSVFFLMLLAGIEMRPDDLARRAGIALPIAVGGIALPLTLGFGVAWAWIPANEVKIAQALVVGLSLAVTAVPVSVTVLLEMGLLRTRIGNVIVGAAVFDDILTLLLLAFVTSLAISHEPWSASDAAQLIGKVVLFCALAFALGWFVLPKIGAASQRFRLPHIDVSLLLAWGFLLALASESLGLHFAVGAFASGLLFRRQSITPDTYERLKGQITALTMGFFAPLFFASIGLHLRPDALTEMPFFLLALVSAAFFGKFFGAGLPARALGLGSREAFAVGAGMNARGSVALIVANIALEAGLFARPVPAPRPVEYVFSAIVIMTISTTVLSPILLRLALRK